MAVDVYEQLASHLDTLPAGFRRTESGVELRILRRLFTADEASLALHLTVIAEEPRVVALRAGLPVEETSRLLRQMELKGLIMSTVDRRGVVRYMGTQFVVGFWEGQVNRLTPELIADFEEYLPQLFDVELWRKMPQMRIVPVNTSIEAHSEVMPYEVVEELVREARGQYSVSNCICRQEMKIAGKDGCSAPVETCLGFGEATADYTTRSGRGRRIDHRELIDILQRADEAGLVLQASNSQRAVFMCTCCGCCCAVLRTIKRHPDPATIVWSAFVATLRADECQGCAACEGRCQMEALSMADGKASLDATRCIGCGLCVTTCPSGALSLVRKPEAEVPQVPRGIVQNYLKVGQARGRYGIADIARLQFRSILDRIRA